MRYGLTQVTTRLIILLELKQDLIVKCLVCLRDEVGEKQTVEFVGLRAKLYSYKMLDGSEEINVRGYKECYKKEYSIR